MPSYRRSLAAAVTVAALSLTGLSATGASADDAVPAGPVDDVVEAAGLTGTVAWAESTVDGLVPPIVYSLGDFALEVAADPVGFARYVIYESREPLQELGRRIRDRIPPLVP